MLIALMLLVYLPLKRKSVLGFKIHVHSSLAIQLNKLLCTLVICSQIFKDWFCRFAGDC